MYYHIRTSLPPAGLQSSGRILACMSAPDLAPLFDPRSIAVVGASNKPGKMGNLFMRRLAAGFRGALYAVNPNEAEVEGIATHPTIAALPDSIDLLIALVPAANLVALVEECRPGQARVLLAIPSGFAEVSSEGAALQQRLRDGARARGMRLVGPNIVGVLNAARGLNASMMPELPPGGVGLSCLTQSGGFGMALAMYALDHALPVAKFCDLGNTADLSVSDVLAYYGDDPDTRVVGLFLESVADPVGFFRTATAVAAKKPVILTAVGRSPAGRRASQAHLGATAGLALEALPQGLVIADTGLDLLHRAKALLWQRPARGRRVAIITGTGGIGAELADLALENGLAVPELSGRLQQQLHRLLPYYASVRNPIDLTPIWWDYPTLYPALIALLSHSDEVDLLVVSITDVAATLSELSAAIAAWAGNRPAMPAIVYWGARHKDRDNMHRIEAAGVPCYASTSEAMRAAAALAAR
jgi:acetyltransferase